jgi:hypothetical protein
VPVRAASTRVVVAVVAGLVLLSALFTGTAEAAAPDGGRTADVAGPAQSSRTDRLTQVAVHRIPTFS